MNEKDGQKQEERSEEEGGNTHPPVPVVHTSESGEERSEGPDQRKETATLHQISRWHRFKEWLSQITVAEVGMLLLTLAIASSGIVYTKYARRQWRVMRDQLPELHTSAQAAKDAADVASQTMKLDQRPWMYATTPPKLRINDNQPIVITVMLVNAGKTPALKPSIDIALYPLGKGVAPDFNYTPGHASYHLEGGSISPTAPTPYALKVIGRGNNNAEIIKGSPAFRKQIASGDTQIIIHGRIVYCDIFRVPHVSTFCSFASGPEDAYATTNKACVDYNDADGNEKPDLQSCPVTK